MLGGTGSGRDYFFDDFSPPLFFPSAAETRDNKCPQFVVDYRSVCACADVRMYIDPVTSLLHLMM